MSELRDFPLGIRDFKFSELYDSARLKALHEEFWTFTEVHAPGLKERFDSLGVTEHTLPQESEILIETAKWLGDFVAKLFNITSYTNKLKAETLELQPIFRFKKEFLNIRVFRRFSEIIIPEETFKEVKEKVQRILNNFPPKGSVDEEQRFAEVVVFFVDCEKKIRSRTPFTGGEQQQILNLCSHLHGNGPEEKVEMALKYFEDWCTQMWNDPNRRVQIQNWASYVRPHKLDFEHLVEYEIPNPELPEMLQGVSSHLRPRDGFKLTDPRMNTKQVLREVDYCIYCHQRDKDSCRKGFPEKTGGFKKNPLGIDLKGCPLDERISEMHWLRKQGDVIASLAMIMLDNPMCPGTGHRICNDCMKGCIFQKQDPVNIPQNETKALTEVLNLPYGFEIYSLLTRFNPLNRRRP
jgi:hypothetical protein